MARMRSLKPEFWLDRKLARSLSRDARMLYMGLWNQADEWGRANADPRVILGQVFPYEDDLAAGDIERLLKELAGAGRIVLYDVDGDPFLYIPTLAEHQRLEPHKVPSRHPEPPPVDDPQQTIPLPEQPVRAAPESDPSGAQTSPESDPSGARAKHVAGSREHVAGQRARRGQSDDDGFADFWAKYPRHKSKDAAKRAWASARKRASAEQILTGLDRYEFRDDAQFIPYPATWLNQGRWEDEPDRPPPEPVGAAARSSVPTWEIR